MPSYESLSIYGKVNFIVQYATIFVNTAGIIGNVLLICLLSRKSFRQHSYAFFSIAKAIVDTIVIAHAYRNWARFNYDANLDTVNTFFCLFINRFFVYTNAFMGIIFMPFISLDRLITIAYPAGTRFQFVKKRWFQWLLVLMNLIYSVLSNLILPLNTKLVSTPNGNVCVIQFDEFTKHSWITVGNIVVFILVINNFINIKLIWHIVKSRRRVSFNTRASQRKTASNKDRKFAVTSIGLSMMAFLFKVPTAIVIIITYSFSLSNDLFSMLFAAGITLLGIDCGAAFYINMLLNPLMRQELKTMLSLQRRGQDVFEIGSGSQHSRRSTKTVGSLKQ